MPFTEPRPRREDIPDDIDPCDVLFEMRLYIWEWRHWRDKTNGDLVFLQHLRAALNDGIRAIAVIVPVLAFVLATLVALRLI
jgi:hypothetical protein